MRWPWQTDWPRSRRVRVPEYSSSEKCELLRSLADHPGFQYLMAEIEERRALLENTRLSLTQQIASQASAEALVRDLIRLDEALFWTGWIQDKVRRAKAMPALRPAERAAEQVSR